MTLNPVTQIVELLGNNEKDISNQPLVEDIYLRDFEIGEKLYTQQFNKVELLGTKFCLNPVIQFD